MVLPPTIGGRVAINLNVALVGLSGAGKGASEAAGRDAIRYIVENPTLPEFSPGSGEGIARMLMENPTALFIASEIDSLAGLFARRGQTLEAEMRKMFMGESLGFSNANKDTRTRVPALSYRAGLIVGVQPLRARVLLAGADGGTPQRFLWVPTRDPQMPEDRPQGMDPLDVVPSYFQPPPGDALHDLKVCGVAREEIDRQQVDYHRGEPGVDPLDGHALLTRLKVACGLMVLAGRSEVTEDDWDLARRVMQVSRATRASIRQAADQQRRQERIAKAADAAAQDEYLSDSKLKRAKAAIARRLDQLHRDEVIARNDLRRVLRDELRNYFDAASWNLSRRALFSRFERNAARGIPWTARTRLYPSHDLRILGVSMGCPRTPQTTPAAKPHLGKLLNFKVIHSNHSASARTALHAKASTPSKQPGQPNRPHSTARCAARAAVAPQDQTAGARYAATRTGSATANRRERHYEDPMVLDMPTIASDPGLRNLWLGPRSCSARPPGVPRLQNLAAGRTPDAAFCGPRLPEPGGRPDQHVHKAPVGVGAGVDRARYVRVLLARRDEMRRPNRWSRSPLSGPATLMSSKPVSAIGWKILRSNTYRASLSNWFLAMGRKMLQGNTYHTTESR